ncbi:MAG: hypothetical protein CSB44_07480 [Gammaproteobacteria bacterium]|nr:MAG: hypothetical protein CSB44_07480 [Gammaproteobacteria bacterium]PIE37776.1 MAG: hypothetical protein CSA54_00710 [Gammaproteobacteria bacterium]
MNNRSFFILSVLLLAACGGSDSNDTAAGNTDGSGSAGGNGDATIQAGILESVAQNLPARYAEMSSRVADLQTAIGGYCESAERVSNHAAVIAPAQSAFAEAMETVQQNLLFQFGPALVDDRMAQLYSWPLSSSCQIDQKLAENETALSASVDRRGLDALGYLLHVAPDDGHSCDDGSETSNPQLAAFDALSADDRQARRCEYMQAVAADASDSARILADAWSVDGGNYGAELVQAGQANANLNAISDALFYLEEVVKENKLDAPLGGGVTNTAPSCGLGQLCPDDVEAPWSRLSKSYVVDNLKGFGILFRGGSEDPATAIGFDDWLADVDEAALAERMLDDVDDAIARLEAIDDSLYDAIGNQTTQVNEVLQGPVQNLGQTLKTEFVRALGLDLPAGSASDTD